ncbi:GntR family transcriptional regulator [Planococcus liqunii]|uniref:GntR family transcriptional regulator n=1 Tax=Planococcus liqunii TaxID=3058394 RepID=A0ABT8MSD3_9BACL|nr:MULTISPECIES: GntR family transcriptional regulator [unclassified Planococcus (in: firmicutes)]MDN7227825.1 GntR family transcriptional regulator [Planococcus sp. N064]WKA53005.1 GntR family transcriptional regulator [Planococcus sp. N056]
MNRDSINLDSPILLYEQIKAGIKELIKTNNLKAGDKIPNESELCELFDVSRITIRRAIKELGEEGIIEVIRGKGTFVRASKKDLHLLNLKGFTEGLSTEENNIEKEILQKQIISSDSELSKIFSPEQTEFVELVRLVKDAEGPFSVDYAYLPLNVYPGIDELLDDSVSTFKLIREKFKVPFTKVKKEIEYVHPTTELCEHLGINKTSTVILVKKIIFGPNQMPVHYSKYYMVGDRVKFYIEADYTE